MSQNDRRYQSSASNISRRRGGVSFAEDEILLGCLDGGDDFESNLQRLEPSGSRDYCQIPGSSKSSSANNEGNDVDSSASGKGPWGFTRLSKLTTNVPHVLVPMPHVPVSMPHPFGGAVSGPLKSIFVGKERESRVSALRTSGLDCSYSENAPVVPEIQSEWEEGSTRQNSNDGTQDDTIREIDRAKSNSSTMHPLDEEDVSESAGTRSNSVDSSTAEVQFENRIKAKMEKGNVNATTKPSPSVEFVAAANRRSSNGDSSAIPFHFESRIKTKMEEGNINAALKPSPSTKYSDGVSRLSSSGDSSTEMTYVENRIQAKVDKGNVKDAVKCSPWTEYAAVASDGLSSGLSSPAEDQIENRIKAKMERVNADTAKKICPSITYTALARHQSSNMNSSTTDIQYENRIKVKIEKVNLNNAAPKHSPSVESTGAASQTANDQFEMRLKAKIGQGKKDKTTAMKLSHPIENIGFSPVKTDEQSENRLKTKMEQGKKVNIEGSKHVSSLESITISSIPAGNQFENRLKAKMEQGKAINIAGMKRNPSMESEGALLAMANHQFENRLKAKMEQGKKGKSTGMKYSPSLKSSGASSKTADEQFEDRMRAKMEQGKKNNGAGMKYHASFKSAVASSATDNQFESRLKAKMEQGKKKKFVGVKYSPSLETICASSLMADDQFEKCLKEQMGSDNMNNISASSPSLESMCTLSTAANNRCEGRLKAKVEQGKGTNDTGMEYTSSLDSVGASFLTSNGQFEDRLKAKMETAKMNYSGSFSSSNDGQFEGRLKAKLGQVRKKISTGMKYSASLESVGDAPSLADDQFEGRLKAKIEQGVNDNNAGTNPSMVEGRLKAKMQKGKHNHNNATKPSLSAGRIGGMHQQAVNVESSIPDMVEKRMREKLEMGNNNVTPVEKNYPKENSKDEEKVGMESDAGATFITQCTKEGKYGDILEYLHCAGSSSPALVTLALDSLSFAHGIFDSTSSGEMRMLHGNWVRVLAVTMSRHCSNEAVQLAALRAILTIVTLNSRHSMEFTSSEEGLKMLTQTMKFFHDLIQIQEVGSCLTACLSSNQKHALVLLRFHSGAVLERLGVALYSNNYSALHAFFRLLTASHQSQTSFSAHLIEIIADSTNYECQGGDITNAVYTVLGVMSDYPKHTGVQYWGSYLLLALFSDEHFLNISITASGQSLSILINHVLHHIETMATPDAPLAVHESAICLLSRMSCNGQICSDGRGAVISRIIVGLMLAQPKSRMIAVHGCHCISNIPEIQETATSAILGVMQGYRDEELAGIAIKSISLLTEKGFQAKFTLLQDEKLISSVVEAMTSYPNSSSIQISACDILSTIALNRHVIGEICACGGADTIISSLYNLPHDRMVVCKAFVALANIIGICDAAILQESRAPKSILGAMEANLTDICIQIRGATILWNLGSCHATLKQEIVQLGGIRTISNAMEKFIASEFMQEKGILALWVLAVSERLEWAATTCAIEAIADAIAAHLTSSNICEHGLGALSTLTGSKFLVKDADNLIDLILSCMWMHSHSATVQQGALAALSKISIDQPTNQVLQVTPEDLDAVTNAMRMHLHVKCVQENAIILLRSFTFSPTNVSVLGQNPFLVGLIKSAMTNFHGSLRANCEGLLWLFPSDNQ